MSELINLIVALPNGRIAVGLNVPTLSPEEAEQLIAQLQPKITEARASRRSSELIGPRRRPTDRLPS